MDITTTDGVTLHVDDAGGDGRPVVLIHGWPLSGASWVQTVPALRDAGLRPITYDRRGFGSSDKPQSGFDYDTLADDLAAVIDGLDLTDVSIVGFSMGGGEVARYLARHGAGKIHSAVFAAAVPPYLMQGEDNPDGPLTADAAQQMESGLEDDREAFFDQFTTQFYSAGDALVVDEEVRQQAIALAGQSDQTAALGCMESFGTTDFRSDLAEVHVPTLVVHGDSDGVVPFEGSGKRTHEAIEGSELQVIAGGPHGLNDSHPDEFNRALVDFLVR